MNVLPVIERELRAQARQPFTYGLRMIGAGSLLAMGFYFTSLPGFGGGGPGNEGGRMFGLMNCALFVAIWALVPLIAADCISRERREGTLGLLFLTPLKALEIVVAKVLAHGLRALTLWLAVIPILTIPFLQGGVGWREAVLSAAMNFSSICLALAAGILASALSKQWLRAQIAACLLGWGFALAFVSLIGCVVAASAFAFARSLSGNFDVARAMVDGFVIAVDFNGIWGEIFSGRAGVRPSLALSWGAIVTLFSLLVLLLTIKTSARRVSRIWQEEGPSARRQWLERLLCTPVVGVAFLHRWMKRKLERNPIGWLEQRSWSGRTVTWGWLAVMVSLYSAAFSGTVAYRAIYNLQQIMAWLLLVGVASSAAGSFQRERETGVMELLLVSPMTVGQIIGGRLRGLWGQFLPAMLLLLSVWWYFRGLFRRQNEDWMQYVAGAFVAVPIIGLYHSLQQRTFIMAFLRTTFSGLVLPFVLQALLFGVATYGMGYNLSRGGSYGWGDEGYPPSLRLARFIAEIANAPLFITLLQSLIAINVGQRLYRDMERRNFAFSRLNT